MRRATTALAIFLAIAFSHAVGTAHAQTVCDSTTVVFAEDTTNFPNPERGFVKYRYIGIGSTLGRTLREEDAQTVVHRLFSLEDFKDGPISETALNRLRDDLSNARDGGIKVSLRFAYTYTQNGTDAPLSRVLAHIDQLAPILQDNSDVIAYVEAGFIGAWGEWYYSTNGLNNTDDRRAVTYALLDALPSNRTVLVRTPQYKQNIFNNLSPLTIDSAYSGSYRSRVGGHNDCFLASSSDYGTFNDGDDRGYWNADNQFVPMGGETCNPSSYSGCENALSELAYFHWSHLNELYHTDVLNSWVTNGCMDEVKKRLGYRFRLLEASLPDSAAPGNRFGLTFSVENQGFASPYNPRNLEIALRNRATGDLWTVLTDEDPRLWSSGDTMHVAIAGGLPETVPAGEYDVLLWLADPEPSLHDRWEYAMRFANQDVWEDTTGFNSMNHVLTVNSDACGDTYTGESWFAPYEPTASVGRKPIELPTRSYIQTTYPNPFNPILSIDFAVEQAGHVSLEVYNVLGEHVATLVDRDMQAGIHMTTWIARGNASGNYLIRLRTNGQVDTRQVTLVH